MSSPPRENRVIVVRGGVIREICDATDYANAIDLGDVALLPALVNVHTHLEFSKLSAPLGTRGNSFPNWIQSVLEFKKSGLRDQSTITQAINQGLQESYLAGVSMLGEIATAPWGYAEHVRAFPKMLVFAELLGIGGNRCEQTIADAEDLSRHLRNTQNDFGLSPHAPYSTSTRLIEYAVEKAKETECCVAMHLAESPEEIELLETGRGDFKDFLESIGLQPDRHFPEPHGILNRLRLLAQCKRALLIHGNYLSQRDKDFLREHPSLTVVYCPRTHAFFHHETHPIEDLLRQGVRVVLGTDSRASSPDLNLWADAQAVHTKHTSIPPESIVGMVTVDAAEAIGATNHGSIEIGRDLDLISIPTAARSIETLFDSLLDAHPKVPGKVPPPAIS